MTKALLRGTPRQTAELTLAGWRRVCAWQRTCGGIWWAWFEREVA